jgi:hypothetical protein
MTERHRTALLTACAAAKRFLAAADLELRGASSGGRQEAQDELEAALRQLDPLTPEVPTVDWREVGKELDHE